MTQYNNNDTMYNTKQYETHNKSVQQSATLKLNIDTRKDYALKLEFFGNAVL